MTTASGDGAQVVVVTGGGGGIGAAIAEELGRQGRHVVTVDPLVTLDGTETLPSPEETTAGRIVAGGGSARASNVSVTDGDAVRDLFAELADEHGGIGAVVNVAGITRPTSFARGTEEDWRSVLDVHLDGYVNVLGAALPIMARTGYGRILGVTSGAGWRPADAGAYSCAKRAVASLTWQLGRHTPTGVVVNAISPIAVTRMVTAALERAKAAAERAGTRSTGGLSLGSMPAPEELGPLAAHLVSDGFAWCNGQVIFAGGSELAVIDEPHPLEIIRSSGVASLPSVIDAVVAKALVPAETSQASTGATNPRFGTTFREPAGGVPPAAASSCVLVTDRPELAGPLVAALDARNVRCHTITAADAAGSFERARAELRAVAEREEPFDAIVVALAGRSAPGSAPGGASGWEQILAEHHGLVEDISADAAWARAATDWAAQAGRPVRLVSVVDATTGGGRSRAQAAAQLARAARGATDDRVSACTVSLESAREEELAAVSELAAHLACAAEATDLSGAELVTGSGWFGLRSHPTPRGSISYGGPDLPPWLDAALQELLGAKNDDGGAR